MRLYGGQVTVLSQEILRTLVKAGDLEISQENMPEVELDIQAVLREYIRMDREITHRAKDIAARGSEGYGSMYRIKRKLAKEKNFVIGEEAIEYMINQLIETFFHSNFVDEVFAEDHDLRRRINPIMRKHMNKEEELDREVRDKIKNLEEGSAAWEVEYQKVLSKLKTAQNVE